MKKILLISIAGIALGYGFATGGCSSSDDDGGGGAGGSAPPPDPKRCIEKCTEETDCLSGWTCGSDGECAAAPADPECETADDCLSLRNGFVGLFGCATNDDCITANQGDTCADVEGGRCFLAVTCDYVGCGAGEEPVTIQDMEAADVCVCANPNWACDAVMGLDRCVAVCDDDDDCNTPGYPVCDTAASRCVPCLETADCAGAQVCDEAAMLCVECLTGDDCDADESCFDGRCGCANNSACSGDTPACYDDGHCGCLDDDDCSGIIDNTSACNTDYGVCECLGDADCTASPLHPNTTWSCE